MSNRKIKVRSLSAGALTTEKLKLASSELMSSRKFLRAFSVSERIMHDSMVSPILRDLLAIPYDKTAPRNMTYHGRGSNFGANGVYNLAFKNTTTDVFTLFQKIPVAPKVEIVSYTGNPKTGNTFQITLRAEEAVFGALGKGLTIDIGERRGEHQFMITGFKGLGASSTEGIYDAQPVSADENYTIPSSLLQTGWVGIINTQLSPEGSLSGTAPLGENWQEIKDIGGMSITRVSQAITGSAYTFGFGNSCIIDLEMDGKVQSFAGVSTNVAQTLFRYMSNNLLYGICNVNRETGEVKNTVNGEQIANVASFDGLINTIINRGEGAIYWSASMSSRQKADILRSIATKISNLFDHYGLSFDVKIYADSLFYDAFWQPALEEIQTSTKNITIFTNVEEGYVPYVGATYGAYKMPNGKCVHVVKTNFSQNGHSTQNVTYKGTTYAKDKGTAIIMPLFTDYDTRTGNAYRNIELLTAGRDGVERGLVLGIEKGMTSTVSSQLNKLFNGKVSGLDNIDSYFKQVSNSKDEDSIHGLSNYGWLIQDVTGMAVLKHL